MVLPTNGFKVTGNVLRMVAAVAAVGSVAAFIVADRLTVGRAIAEIPRLQEYYVTMDATLDTVRVQQSTLLHRGCLMLAVLARDNPDDLALASEARRCEREETK